MNEIVTFDFILGCWKKKEYPENFKALLEKYLERQQDDFIEIEIKERKWFDRLVTAVEIGVSIDPEKFSYFKNYWDKLLAREWEINLENMVVLWKGQKLKI